MKKVFVLFVIFSCIHTSAMLAQSISDTARLWNYEKEIQFLLDRQDSLKWDINMLDSEISDIDPAEASKPILDGVFPVPNYDLPYTDFKGMGNCPALLVKDKRSVEDKTILFNSFSILRNRYNEAYIEDNTDEIYFHIIVLTDYIDSLNFSHAESLSFSRNNPHFMGEGFFKTKNSRIDYVSFITADRDMFAIVNMRLFNLKYGKTILIAPQKDGSFRSMQIKSPILSSKNIYDYTDRLLKERNVRDFFLSFGNI